MPIADENTPNTGIAENPGSEATAEQFPSALSGVGNLDRFGDQDIDFTSEEQQLLTRIVASVEEGAYDLPHLPSTHLTLLELTADPESEMSKVENLVSADAVLTATLLKVANSALYGGARDIDSVRGAVLRIGLRGLRTLLYSQSVKSVIFRSKGLMLFAEEVWRQACSVAALCRSNATFLRQDPDRSYVLGLLHDMGKIPLVSILRKEAPGSFPFRGPFIGTIFSSYHEQVGRQLATAWNLPEEIVQVAGCHHAYANNSGHKKSAALVYLAHRQDQYLSTGNAEAYVGLMDDAVWDTLEVGESLREPLLRDGQERFLAATDSDPFLAA